MSTTQSSVEIGRYESIRFIETNPQASHAARVCVATCHWAYGSSKHPFPMPDDFATKFKGAIRVGQWLATGK